MPLGSRRLHSVKRRTKTAADTAYNSIPGATTSRYRTSALRFLAHGSKFRCQSFARRNSRIILEQIAFRNPSEDRHVRRFAGRTNPSYGGSDGLVLWRVGCCLVEAIPCAFGVVPPRRL